MEGRKKAVVIVAIFLAVVGTAYKTSTSDAHLLMLSEIDADLVIFSSSGSFVLDTAVFANDLPIHIVSDKFAGKIFVESKDLGLKDSVLVSSGVFLKYSVLYISKENKSISVEISKHLFQPVFQ